MIEPPATEDQLLRRADELAGSSLGEVAARVGTPVPLDLRRAKGWTGTLIEKVLGAQAASRALPDFPDWGIELKTLPVDRRGRPVESTFVCTIDLRRIPEIEWEASRLWGKLARVLWVPVQGDRDIPPGERRIGQPLLWSPSPDQVRVLRGDWERLVDLISQNRFEEITGHLGSALQVRPKAARGSSRRRVLDEDGLYDQQPKGFYLRASFTGALLAEAFVLPAT